MGKSIINGHFQWLCKRLPEGIVYYFVASTIPFWGQILTRPWAISDTTFGHSTTFSEGQWFYVVWHFLFCPQDRKMWPVALGTPDTGIWTKLALFFECKGLDFQSHTGSDPLSLAAQQSVAYLSLSSPRAFCHWVQQTRPCAGPVDPNLHHMVSIDGGPPNGWFINVYNSIKWLVYNGNSYITPYPSISKGCEDHPLISYHYRWHYLALNAGWKIPVQSGLGMSWA